MQDFGEQRVTADREYNKAIAPIIADLASNGFEVPSLDVLAKSKAYKEAVPILVKWLPVVTDPRIKEAIVRTLSVPWAGPEAAKSLVIEFRNAPASTNTGLKWAIGNALEVVATEDIFEELIELAQDKRHGKAREMVAMAIGKIKNPRSDDVLIGLLDDEEVAGHALIGLRKLNAKEALPFIRRFVNHPKTWIRQEAIKAIAKMEK